MAAETPTSAAEAPTSTVKLSTIPMWRLSPASTLGAVSQLWYRPPRRRLLLCRYLHGMSSPAAPLGGRSISIRRLASPCTPNRPSLVARPQRPTLRLCQRPRQLRRQQPLRRRCRVADSGGRGQHDGTGMRIQTGNLLQRRTGSAGALVTGAAMVPGMFPGRGAAGSILRR